MLIRLLLLLSIAGSAFAGSVLDVNGPIFGFTGASGITLAWSASIPLNNVQVVASLANGGGAPQYGIGTAYLTNSLGPGTTLANLVAQSPIQMTCLGFCEEQVVLFSGLNLAAGEYFMTIGAPAPPVSYLNWSVTHAPTVVAAPGITFQGWRQMSDATGPFPPSSNVVSSLPGDYLVQQLFSVSSDVPEPASIWSAAIGLAALAGAFVRRR